jgi:hypothetical protein
MPPSRPTLPAPHHRICRTCTNASLPLLHGTLKVVQRCSSLSPSSPPESLYTAGAFRKRQDASLHCASLPKAPSDNVVWLCAPYGKDPGNTNTKYTRSCIWRTRYNHSLDSVGTGADEGKRTSRCAHRSIRDLQSMYIGLLVDWQCISYSRVTSITERHKL